MDRVLVIGASGYIGSHLVPKLQTAGYMVRAASPSVEILEGRNWADVELVQADALRPETLPCALADVQTVYYLAHSTGATPAMTARNHEAVANVREAAAAAGVRRIICLGSLSPGSQLFHPLDGRDEAGSTLRAGEVPVTEIRAGIIVGPGSVGFDLIRDLVNRLPVMLTPRWARSRTQPIALDDLVEYLARVAALPETAGAIFEAAGPESLRFRDLIEQFAELTGKKRVLIPVPFMARRFSAWAMDVVTSVPASVVRPLVDGLSHDRIVDDRRIRSLVPIELHTYREAVLMAIEAERSQQMHARWSDEAFPFNGYHAEASFYTKRERREVIVNAPTDDVWRAISSIGGGQGYYHANALWRLRGALDRAVGGVGLRRRRRHPQELRPGDAVDFWRVVAVDPGRRLRLAAEMKLPGWATLEFEVAPTDGVTSRLTMTARFRPSGIAGILYWYALLPVHNIIFRGMPRNLARSAERAWASQQNSATAAPPRAAG
jgi:uncharacterized protein YbjT (DUF2867 family)